MWKRFCASFLALLLLGWINASRADTSLETLASLQSEMDALALQKQAFLAREGRALQKVAAASLEQIDSDLRALSEQAAVLAQNQETPERVALSAWLTALHAAWLALPLGRDALDDREVEQALELAERGRATCQRAEQRSGFSSPRDCALIRFAPSQIAFQVSWGRYESLKARGRAGAQPADYFEELAHLYYHYKLAVWERAWEEKAVLIAYNPALEESLGRYLDDEIFLFLCSAMVPYPGLLEAVAEPAAEAERTAALDSYRGLLAALAERLDVGEDELLADTMQSCTSFIESLGLDS